MTEQFANFAQSTLSSAITAAQTTLTVANASSFPLQGNFRIVVQSYDVTTQNPVSAPELMLVTAVAGKQFTVQRGIESTQAIAFASGAQVSHIVTAGVMQALSGGGSSYIFSDSLVNNSGTVTLVNDSVSPGTSKYYGTDGAGALGYHVLGGGSGTVTTTGTPASGNLTKFSGSTAITNGDLSGDVTTSGSLVTTVVKVNGVTYSASPSTNTVPVVTGANTITYEAVPNAALANSSVTISGHALSLGGTLSLAAADVGLGSVTNDAQTKAAIVPNTAPSGGQILVGNAGGTAYAPASLSGSGATISLASTGVMTVSGIANASLSNSSITIAGTSTSLGGSISQDTITGLASTGIVKRTAANTLAIASSGSDYAPATSGSSILFGNGSGGFSNVTIGTNLTFAGGTLSASGGGGSLTVTDGTHSVAGTTQITFSGATVSGTSPNATVTITGGAGGVSSITGDGTYITNSASTGAVTLTTTFGTAAQKNTGTSGANVPLLNGANTWSGTQTFNSGDLILAGSTSGTLTVKPAAVAGANTITLPAGTTDFSATGGASQVVKQTSAGGAFTVAQLASGDISGLAASATTDTTNASNISSGTLATGRLPTNQTKREVTFTLDGQGSAIASGGTWYLSAVPFAGTITAWNLVADQSGSIVMDVWKTNAAVPTIANTITASALPTLASAQAAFNGAITAWTTAVSAGDVFAFHVNSASTVTKANLTIMITAS